MRLGLLIFFLLLPVARSGMGFMLPMIIKVPPRYSFSVAWGNGAVTNVGYVTNWTSPALAAGSNWFCVKTVEGGTNESDCLSGWSSNTAAQPRTTLTWSVQQVIQPPFTNIVVMGTEWESSTNGKDFGFAFATADRFLTNPTPGALFYRVKATVKNSQ